MTLSMGLYALAFLLGGWIGAKRATLVYLRGQEQWVSLGVWRTEFVHKDDDTLQYTVTAEAMEMNGERKLVLVHGAGISRERIMRDWAAGQRLMLWEQGGELPPKEMQ